MADLESTYLNPVYPHSFPDPFVIKYCGSYYAYATGHAPDGRVFEVLRSTDLVHWEPVGGAMEPLTTGEPFYWAPEVTYYNGKFCLYYSVGNETLMTLRVAVSDSPDGGFVDTGAKLTSQQFAIDAHVFRDTNGSWWMFYATDFLDHSHIGTGTVVDRMLDMFTLEGDPRPVTRAKYDWQVYDPERKEKGGVRWHTVEGPFVMERKGTYYEMFSGGNWQNISYGVSFAVSDDLTDPAEWHQYSDGEKTLPLIRTIPGKVLGPGHNSVIRGPNNRELYCVYHLWNEGERVLAIDRMDFAGGKRIFVSGPTFSPQARPFLPAVASSARLPGDAVSTGSSFHCEISLEPRDNSGVSLLDAKGGVVGRLTLRTGELSAFVWSPTDGAEQLAPSATVLHGNAIHEISIDVDRRAAFFQLNGCDAVIRARLEAPVESMSTEDASAIAAVSVTRGFEDLFEVDDAELRGWVRHGDIGWDGEECVLFMGAGARISRQVQPGDFELCVNMLVSAGAEATVDCGVTCRVSLSSIALGADVLTRSTTDLTDVFRQYRLVRQNGSVTLWVDGVETGRSAAPMDNQLNVTSGGGNIFLDMVRWTAI